MTQPPTPADPPGTVHTLVTASAGSGKTFQLSNAFIAHLARGEQPDRILATTFTRAAAGEILDRVIKRLATAALNSNALDELQALTDNALTQDRCHEALAALARSLHRLPVQTLDAFFARIATAFTLELGLTPGWRIADEDEQQALRERAIEDTLNTADRAQLIEIIRDMRSGNQTAAHATIASTINQGFDAFTETRDREDAWRAIPPAGRPLNKHQIAEAVNTLRNTPGPTTNAGKPVVNIAKEVNKLAEAMSVGDWENAAKSGLVKALRKDNPTYYKKPITGPFADAIRPLADHATYEVTNQHARRTLAIRRLAEAYDTALTAARETTGIYDFGAPLERLLRTNALEDQSRLAYRLDGSIGQVLLDEFQDTSIKQFRVLEPLLDELLSQAPDDRAVFCVGDTKQSLYQWRDAEPTLLPAMASRWSTFQQRTLAKSYRSGPAIIETVNRLFATPTTNPAFADASPAARQAAANWEAQFTEHKWAHASKPSRASLKACPDDAPEPQAMAAMAAKLARDALDRDPASTVAITLRNGKAIAPVLANLHRLGIEASERRGNPLTDSPPVAAALSVLRFALHPTHTAGLFHAARTPLGQLLDLPPHPVPPATANTIAADLRRELARRALPETLAAWLAEIRPHTDARNAARFTQFITLAERLKHDGRLGIETLLNAAESTPFESPGGGARVRVMTIHGSKGLEFDTVIIPLPGRPWQLKHTTVLTRRESPLLPITAVTRYPNEDLRAAHPDLEAIHHHNAKRVINEELCCLYVAATRARHNLELIVHPDHAAADQPPATPSEWKLNPAHIVRAALAPHEPAIPNATLWSIQRPADTSPAITPAADTPTPAPIPAPPPPLRVRAPKRRPTARLTAVSPSDEHSTPVDAGSIFIPREEESRRAGDAMHRLLEQVTWLDHQPESDRNLNAPLAEIFDRDEDAEAMITRFNRLLAALEVRETLTHDSWLAARPDATSVELATERPFAVRDDNADHPRLLRGRFDRLAVAYAGSKPIAAQIIDFKTDAAANNASDERLNQLALAHEPQLSAYRRAAAILYSLDNTRVETAVLFTEAPAIVPVHKLNA